MFITTKSRATKYDRSAFRTVLTVLMAFVMSTMAAFAQNAVNGTVTDTAGEPLIGASVQVKGTHTGVATDIDGHFSIQVAQGKTLTISYIGYTSKDVVVNGNNLNIVLSEDNELLNEVVVVGYGSLQRKDVTGSITTVQAKDLNTGSYIDPGQLLQGKVPGLVVVQNSDPNGGVNSITLRGASTLNGSTSPLYVVDGIPVSNDYLNLVSPNDIESIDVLRDASATAIYGSKAANGVIIITTKRGVEGPAHVTYSGYASWDKVANDHDMMTASELRDYAARHNINLNNDMGADTDWADEVQRTGFAHNHNLSISGGSKSTSYTASVNYIARDGIIRGVGNNLFTGRAYVETKTLKDRLTIGVGVNGNVREEWGVTRTSDGKSVYNAMYYYSPLVPVYNEDGTWYSDKSISQNYNPLSMIYENQSMSTLKRYQLTGKASLKIIEGLSLNANFSYMNNSRDYKDYYSHQSEINNRGGETSRTTSTDVGKLMEIYGNYDRTFKDVHKLSLMAGYSWEEWSIGEGFGARGYNFYDDTLWWNNIGMANSWDEDPVWANVQNGNLQSIKRMISFYGRANYSFDSRYIIQAAVRRDGASTFGANNRWATFPSASVAWRLGEESFIKDLDIFSDLKIRAGWGQSGNSSGFDIYTSRFFYQSGARFDYIDPVTGKTLSFKSLNAARNQNDDLKWETTTMLNLGLDFSFLNGRINGSIEYYNKETKDMIWDYAVSTTRYPVGKLTANVGKMRNRGFEVVINATPIQGPFTWTTSMNFSHNSNKIVSISDPSGGFNAGILNRYNPNLPGASTATTQRIIEGQPIGTFYLYEWAGYDENGNSVFYTYNKANEETTGERAVDENGNYILTNTPEEKDRVIAGNAQPKLTMGWNNTFNWKNWDLNVFFTGVFGQKIFNEPRAYFGYVSNVALGKNVLADIESFQNPNDGYSAIPSDRWLENGSYFKLATLTLGYTFRNCFDGWLNNIRVYASANNVFTITGYKGRDPEINLGGLEPGHDTRSDHFPRTRQFLVGATINF